MTKLELTVSAETLECVSYDEATAKVLGLPQTVASSEESKGQPRVHISTVLADQNEMQQFQSTVDKLLRTNQQQQRQHIASVCTFSSFETLNLVFRAPNAPSAALTADRSPLNGIFCCLNRAIHTSNDLHLCCFTHIHYDALEGVFRITALEYSRNHRSQLLRQEFASWLVEEHIEKSVIATRADGTVVFWNRFATSLYQYTPEEAMGQEIRNLISSKLSLQQGDELMKRMAQGEHFTSMYLCSRKDQSEFMAHVTTTPINDDQGQTQFLVGVSADYSQLHNVLVKLERLNANLEREVVARTEQLLAREKHLRMIGAAMKESDTGVLITDSNYKITWCNDAVSRMLGLKKEVILGMFPWDLPLQQEQKQDANVDSHSNVLNMMAEEKSSSLESYFLQEKAFNESSSGGVRLNMNNKTTAVEDAESSNNKNGNLVPSADADMPDATMTSTSTNEDDGEASASAVIANASATTPPKRPPMAAICYRIESPSMPLHIMVSVEIMPPDKPMKIHRSSSKALRKPLRDALDLTEMQVDAYIPLEPAPNMLDQPEDETTTEVDAAEPSLIEEAEEEREIPPKMQFMITLRDITAERKAEEAQLVAERASAANEAKTQMMQMLSHELRTPLQGIMGVASTSMMDIEDLDNSSASNNTTGSELINANNTATTLCGGAAAAAAGNTGGVKGTMYDSLSTILASSRLLLTLINNTLDTRKINADMMQKIELSTVSMMSCIRDSFQYCGPFAAINEAVLELSDPASNCGGGGDNSNNVKLQQILNTSKSNLMHDVLKKKFNVVGNRLRLEQVIVNLLSNGIKYTTPGTSVVASVRNSTLAQVLEEMKAVPSSSLKFLTEEEMRELEESCTNQNGGEVSIFSVRDHGNGIPPEEYGKVFGEFQQLDASAEKDNKYDGSGSGQSSGSGLGLNLSMKFVTLMHGHIWFQNCTDGGGGVTFSFYLNRARPQRDSALSLAGREVEPGNASTAPTSNESGRSDSFRVDDQELQEEKVARIRVLVIDDSMINLKVLARMMTKLKVQHCKTALSGAAALEYLEPIRNDPSLVPNLILCDLQMPGMDGYELMIHLREMNICSSPIIMACSADWGSETEGKCHDVGFDGLLRKPITVTYLKEFLTNSKL